MNNPVEIEEAPESLYVILEMENPLMARPVVVRDEDEVRMLVAFTADGLENGFHTLKESAGLVPGTYIAEEMDFPDIAILIGENECAGVAVDYSEDEPYRQILIAKAKYGEG